MVLTPRLDQRQTQALVMTPQLQQAIKLLQLNNLELAEFVEQELESNPLLEREESEAAEVSDEAVAEADAADADGVGLEVEALESIDLDQSIGAEIPEDRTLDAEVDNVYTNDSGADLGAAANNGEEFRDSFALGPVSGAAGAGGGGYDGDLPGMEETLSQEVSLRDHLMDQLSCDLDDPVDRVIGIHLMDLLDDAGYLVADLAEVADTLGTTPRRVASTLARLQDFDPPGIFARNLKECLALQLQDRDRYDPAMQAFVENLELLAKRDLAALERVCGVDAEDIADMADEIRTLDPKPALKFETWVAQPIVPDVMMRPQSGGGWLVELNNETLPRILVNNHYYARIAKEANAKADRRYITEQFQAANWLVKTLHQRATTILKVASELVRQQEAFFSRGVQHLKPLVLRDIADVIEMHESTVSRVTSNKYMATPRGIYELKYFFTTAIGSTLGGDAHSAESVRHRIKSLIDEEPAKKVLSDDKIVDILRAEGIDIARRTVAKYREALGIRSSIQRRREKAALR